MLDVKDLTASVDGKTILRGVTLSFEPGKNYCLLGKNGSGKSSLSSVLMGHPRYRVDGGSVTADGKDLLAMSPEDRSAAGVFLSFQNVPEVKGVRLGEYLRTVANVHLAHRDASAKPLTPFVFKRFLAPFLQELDIPEAFLDRDLNAGFSGGEKRKVEMLQLRLIRPRYVILDEVDSGLDLDAFRTIAAMLAKMAGPEVSLIVITHYFTIIDTVPVHGVYLLEDGKVIRSGGRELAEEIRASGFRKECLECPLPCKEPLLSVGADS